MASRHPTSTLTTTVCYGCCTCTCTCPCTVCHHPPTNLYNIPYPNNAPALNPNPPYYTNQTLHHHQHYHQQAQYHSLPTGQRYFQFDQQHAHDHPSTVSSLLRRIAALESIFSHHSSRKSRDAAARTIQTHFRAFLVRRSTTRRQLRELASIKSTLNVLISSVSEDTHFDPQSHYHKASKLLFKLDSIQGGDPMIRDGKISIHTELTRLLDFIHGFTHRRSQISAGLVTREKTEEGVYGGRNNKVLLEDLVTGVNALSGKLPQQQQDDESDEVVDCHEIPHNKQMNLEFHR